MHPLLRRQIRRHLGDAVPEDGPLTDFIAAVGAAYRESDADRLLLERSLELSSQELLLANSEMRAIFQALPDLFFRLDAEGRILDCRGGRAQQLLLPAERLIGKRIDRVPVPAVAAAFRAARKRIAIDKVGVVIEYSLPHGGDLRYHEARLVPVLEGQTVVIIRETTDRARAAEVLGRQQAFLRQVIDLNPSFIFAKDVEGRFSLVNQALADAYGRTVDEILGKRDADFNPDAEELRDLRQMDMEVITTGRDLFIPEERLTDARGRTMYLQTIKRAILAPDGQSRQVLGVATDITQRRQAEERLELRNRQILEHQAALHEMAILDHSDLTSALWGIIEISASTLRTSRAGIWLFSDDRKTLQNRCLYRAGEAWAEEDAALTAARHPRYFEAMNSGRIIAADDAEQDPRTREFAAEYLRPLGITSLLATAIRQQGQILGVLRFEHAGPPRVWTPEEQNFAASTADLVALALAAFSRQQLEHQLRQSQKMEAVGTLAGGIAHDFNNILTAILGYCDLLLGKLQAESPEHAYAREVWKASDRAAALTRQLLTFSRKQHTMPRVVDLGRIVTGLEPMLKRLIGADIEFAIQLDPAARPVTVDPGQIEQVVLNLVVNAREAMPSGGRLTIEVRNDESNGAPPAELEPGTSAAAVELRVTDTGCGMDEATRSRIFEPFFTTKAPGKGTGLGLAIAYAIVRQSGGLIQADSSMGLGTTFSVLLPAADEVATAESEPEAPAPAAGGSETILLAEDEDALRTLISMVLSARGYRVIAAADGESALDIARSEAGRIDLLVTDMIMPGMSGARLSELLLTERPDLRVLYLSGYTADNIVPVDGRQPGRAFLQKPFAIETLAATIRDLLEGSSDEPLRRAAGAAG